MASKQVRVIFSKIFFMLLSSFFLGVMTPLYFAELDGLGACIPFCCFQYLDWFLLVGQVTFQLHFLEGTISFNGVSDILG
jgi:hypothetical protein